MAAEEVVEAEADRLPEKENHRENGITMSELESAADPPSRNKKRRRRRKINLDFSLDFPVSSFKALHSAQGQQWPGRL